MWIRMFHSLRKYLTEEFIEILNSIEIWCVDSNLRVFRKIYKECLFIDRKIFHLIVQYFNCISNYICTNGLVFIENENFSIL